MQPKSLALLRTREYVSYRLVLRIAPFVLVRDIELQVPVVSVGARATRLFGNRRFGKHLLQTCSAASASSLVSRLSTTRVSEAHVLIKKPTSA